MLNNLQNTSTYVLRYYGLIVFNVLPTDMDVPLSSNTSLALNVMFALDVVTSGIDLTDTVNSQLRICICSNKQKLQKEKVYFFHKNKVFC
jgi:hypothetical protein